MDSQHRADLPEVRRSAIVQDILDDLRRRLDVQVRTVQLQERQRIARELHDEVAHGIVLALQRLDLYRYNPGRAGDGAAAGLTRVELVLRDTLRTVRELTAGLRPSVGEEGIEHALRRYLQANECGPTRTSLAVTGAPAALPSDISEELYQIMREATCNALRHASASEVCVSLHVDAGEVWASVSDNGSGFDPTGLGSTSGDGLLSMRERAVLLRTTLHLVSEVGKGTTVSVRFHLTDVP